jgi:hypothetical protein
MDQFAWDPVELPLELENHRCDFSCDFVGLLTPTCLALTCAEE